MNIKLAILSCALGLFGMFLALFIWHTYTDHKVFHQLINAAIQQQQQNQSRTQLNQGETNAQ